MTPGVLGGEVVVDAVEGGVVIIDCDREGPDDDQEGSADKVESSHEVSSDVEKPDLGNVVTGDKGEHPYEHNDEPGTPVKENAEPLSNTEDGLESKVREEGTSNSSVGDGGTISCCGIEFIRLKVLLGEDIRIV